jgi:hypothetical protein
MLTVPASEQRYLSRAVTLIAHGATTLKADPDRYSGCGTKTNAHDVENASKNVPSERFKAMPTEQ